MTNAAGFSGPLSLSVHLLHFPVRTLGPGTRAGLWCQGCGIRCPGCITPETWEFLPENAVPVETLAERIENLFPHSAMAGEDRRLTISGGEPFDQAEALLALLNLLNERGIRDILIYSGYRLENLRARCPDLPDLAAALVDGPFERGRPTGATWKGSDNQRLHIFRPEFEARYREWEQAANWKLQLVTAGGGEKYLIGIPKQEDAKRLKKLQQQVP